MVSIRRFLSVSAAAGFAAIAMAGCDSSGPVSASTPPPAVVPGPSVTNPTPPIGPQHPRPDASHDVGVDELRDGRLFLDVKSDQLNEIFADQNEKNTSVAHDGQVVRLDSIATRDSECSLSPRPTEKLQVGDEIEFINIKVDARDELTATSKKGDMTLDCVNRNGQSKFLVSDLDRILGGLATVVIDNDK